MMGTTPRSATISVLLVEDHASFRQALRAVMSMEDDLDIVAEVGRGDEAAAAAGRTRPDIALVDLDLPGTDGIAAVEAIRAASPHTACIVLTALTDDAEMGRAVAAGAVAILHKSAEMEQILQVMRDAAGGATSLPAADLRRWLQARQQAQEAGWHSRVLASSLTPRERQVLELLAQGGTNRSVARELGISDGTVQTHIRNLMAKFDERSRLGLVTTALRLGLVDPRLDRPPTVPRHPNDDRTKP